MSDDVPMKRCNKCPEGDQWHPATTEYFYRDRSNKKFGLKSLCIACNKRMNKASSKPDGHISARALAISMGINDSKVTKDIHSGILRATNIGKGVKKYWTISPDDAEEYRRFLLKTKVGTPEQCGACGTTASHIFGDVNHDTQEKYGYLCGKCSKLVRDFQGDSKRIRNVLGYIERTRKAERHINKTPITLTS